MNPRLAIRVEGISKDYLIGDERARHDTFREMLSAVVRAPFRRLRKGGDAAQDRRIWALQDVSFDVAAGEVVAIIGRNGAGKSTLLKVLSRITDPSRGEACIRGRVASLLEVGTGFHPELTGRENIYLNGSILGMTRADIRAKFDAIVQFAEVERFLDTPVKRYSSGMYVRLAFAVAAHLDTDVLIVDEVLAVGDAAFQRKCLGTMRSVAESGRTVLFVSHNMASVRQLCSRGIVLDAGAVRFQGPVEEAIASYLSSVDADLATADLRSRADRRGNGALRFVKAELCSGDGTPVPRVASGQDVRLRLHYEAPAVLPGVNARIAFNVQNAAGVVLTHLSTELSGHAESSIHRSGYFECFWPRLNLRAGSYTCTLFGEVNREIADWIQGAFQIQVEDGNYYQTGRVSPPGQGDMLVEHRWTNVDHVQPR